MLHFSMARYRGGWVVCYLLVLAMMLESVQGGFVYFHHYLKYDNAYKVCRYHNMRLVRVDTDAKHQALMDFTKGVENFTVGSTTFTMSLKYNVTSNDYRWPDNTFNTLDTEWKNDKPTTPEAVTNKCVVQYGGQSRYFGQWRTQDCEKRSPFICETGQPEDPDLSISDVEGLSYWTFLKINSSSLNIYNSTQANFRFADSDFVIYQGHKEDDISVCAVGCMMDEVCTGIMYTTNNSPYAYGDMCIYLQHNRQ